MDDLKAWREQAKPYSASVDICPDMELVAELERAEREVEERRAEKMIEIPAELEAHVQALAKSVESKMRTFTFQSIGRRNWRKLISEHPPTAEQREQDPELDHNPDTFPAAAFEASCIEPKLSTEDAEWLTDLPEGEFMRLWGACLKANLIGGDAKKAVATAAAAHSAKK